MHRHEWLLMLRRAMSPYSRRRNSQSSRPPAALRRATFEPLEERTPLAVLTVNSTLDNATPGDGLVTLREAVIAANTNATTDLGQTGSGEDVIEFDSAAFGTPKTIDLIFGELLVTQGLTINGPGQTLLTIDARQNFRIFDSATGITVSGATLANGRSTNDGGAIRSQGDVTLVECTIIGSQATGRGGGVYSGGSVIVVDSLITGNRTTGNNNRNGGGIYAVQLSVTGSTISGNTAASSGGGFFALGATVVDSTVSDNTAGGSGGGFALYYRPFGGTSNVATVNRSTISGNRATQDGGGFTGTFIEVSDSMITGNTTQGRGGGFAASTTRDSFGQYLGTVDVIDSTIHGNEAAIQGGGFAAPNETTVTRSVVSENRGSGIYAQFGVTVNSSTIKDNTSNGPGAGILSTGGMRAGGIGGPRPFNGPVVLIQSTVTGNVSQASGGGIYAGGLATLNSSTVSGNEAVAGGGVFVKTIIYSQVFGNIYTGTATIQSSTVNDNESAGPGGGINSRGAVILSSTVSGNRGGAGGGIYTHNDAIVRDSTITGNVTVNGVGGGFWNGDDQTTPQLDPSVVTIERSIIAGNMADGGSPDLRPGGGTLTVKASLIGDNAGTSLAEAQSFDANGNLIGSAAGGGIINPRLEPLDDNGGPTKTHALLDDSPAIDAVPYYVGGPIPAHDYQLNNSLADAFGGPNLVAAGGTLGATGYTFAANQGLSGPSELTNPGQYSIELLFRWNALSGGWQKIIDFHNLASNVGLYTAGSGLHFLDVAFVPNQFMANTLYRLVLTRDDATDMVRVYLNGSEVMSFTDSSGDAVFDGPNQVMHFFRDDNTTGQSEAQAGFVDLIRVYNEVLTPAQISGLPSHTPIAVPPHDQRGAPYARVVDGDGVGLPQVDMGAYELQPEIIVLAGDYNKNGIVDTADYVIWRKTLSMNVPNGTGADGNGDGVVTENDYGVWRTNFGRTQGEEAEAAIVQGSIAATDAAVVEAAPPLARSNDGGMPPLPPSPAVAVTQSISSRGSSSRTVLQSPFDAVATRDAALLAWEAARLAAVEQSPSTRATLNGPKQSRAQLTQVHELADIDLSCKHVVAFDCAIETLGV